jgi:myo-inositol-1(or 4)-monophosphatase
MSQCAGVRRPGAAALDLAYVAAGYADGFFESGLQPWDVAAGSLLVTEAGGLVGNYTGEADFMHQGECVAGNPRVYAQLVGVLTKYSKFASVADKLQVQTSLQSDSAAAEPAQPAEPTAKPVLKMRKVPAADASGAAKPKSRPAPGH